MKILIVSGTDKRFNKDIPMRWYMLPYHFAKQRHKVRYVIKKEWWKVPFIYWSFKPDVVIGVGLFAFIPAVMKKLRVLRKPLVFDWNDVYHEVMGIKHNPAKISYIEYYCAKNSDLVLTPSKFLEHKCKLLDINTSFIGHGCDLKFTNTKKTKLPGKNKFKAFYVGEISKYKGVFDLVKSVEKLPYIDLCIAGPNKLVNYKTKDNIHFLGKINHDDLPKYLNSADTLILANDQDSALKMYDYIKAGNCILAKKGRISYILDHNYNVYTSEDLGKGLLHLYNNKKLRLELKKNIKKIKVLSWDDITKKYISKIKGLL